MTEAIPQSHVDLVDNPVVAVLATVMADGSPQATPVWLDREGELLRVNTVRGRVKDLNMRARPHVVLTLVDPKNPYRYLMVRGEVIGDTEQGAVEHINSLSAEYRGDPNFPVAEGDVRVIYHIRPTSVFIRP